MTLHACTWQNQNVYVQLYMLWHMQLDRLLTSVAEVTHIIESKIACYTLARTQCLFGLPNQPRSCCRNPNSICWHCLQVAKSGLNQHSKQRLLSQACPEVPGWQVLICLQCNWLIKVRQEAWGDFQNAMIHATLHAAKQKQWLWHVWTPAVVAVDMIHTCISIKFNEV